VAGVSTSSNNNSALTILGLLLLAGIIGGIYLKNKKDKNKPSPDN
jgi:LPXTG-motif cell wall-anchored protein